MDAQEAPLQDVQYWLLQDVNEHLIPTRRIYILAGIWNFVEKYHEGNKEGVKGKDAGITNTALLAEYQDIIHETIQRVEAKYQGIRVVICPIIGIHIEGHNSHKGIESFADMSNEQNRLNDLLIDANNIIQRINKDRGLATPRFDRNYFYYNCRSKSYKIYYPKLDNTRFVSDELFSKQIAEKIAACMHD